MKEDAEPKVEKEAHHGEHSRQSSSSDSGVVRWVIGQTIGVPLFDDS